MKRNSKPSVTTQYLVLFGLLFLLTDIALGIILHHQSSAMVQSLIRRNMLNISNTAAALVDGDVIGSFTEEDVGTPAYNEIYRELAAFQNNAEIEFIYAVRQVGEEKYVFTVDPDPVDPGAFGEEIVVTMALREAGKGKATVDNEPAEDRWGNFYTSYSPIFDSQGNVAGIVGVDFNSSWFNQQIWKNTWFIILISFLFTLVGILIFILISLRVRRRFNDLGNELSTLSDDVEELTRLIISNSSYKGISSETDLLDEKEEDGLEEKRESENRDNLDGEIKSDGRDGRGKQGSLDERICMASQDKLHDKLDGGESDGGESESDDEIRALAKKIRAMHKEMELYIDYVHAQVGTDALTGVGNTTAYMDRQKELNSKIADQTADFSVVMFDIDNLKQINDRYGHASGDVVIAAAGSVIARCFGKDNTYRVGGDEFISIVERMTKDRLEKKLARIDRSIASYNEEKGDEGPRLSISKGQAVYDPGKDQSFQDVFVRADKQMYECKDHFHRRNRSSELMLDYQI